MKYSYYSHRPPLRLAFFVRGTCRYAMRRTSGGCVDPNKMTTAAQVETSQMVRRALSISKCPAGDIGRLGEVTKEVRRLALSVMSELPVIRPGRV
jgi:hypothetical protein